MAPISLTPEVHQKPLVSVVVPMYNVEALLPRCLDSLTTQTHRNLQLILVDDGSPDGSGRIADDYAARDDRIVVIHQKNQGVGPARNAGIERATGEFLAFVDPDDYVTPDYVARMLDRCLLDDADVCVCNFTFEFSSGLKVPFPLMTLRRSLTGEQAGRDSLDLLTIPVFVWNKLYRRRLFTETGIRFPGMYYEDIAIMTQVLSQADRVSVTHKSLYFYCLREGSITGTFTTKNLHDYLRAVEIIRDFIYDSGRWQEWGRPYLGFLLHTWFMVQAELLAQPDLGFSERLAVMHETDRAFEALRPPPDRPRRPRPETPVVPADDDDEAPAPLVPGVAKSSAP